jgi:hypothetical protein
MVKRHPVGIGGIESISVLPPRPRRWPSENPKTWRVTGLKYQLFHIVKSEFVISKMP